MDKAKALRDILMFEAGITLRPYQVELSDILLDIILSDEGDEIGVLQSRQSGKTETIADTLLTVGVFYPNVMKRKLSIGIFAPAFSQATQVARRRLFTRYTSVRQFLEGFDITMDIGRAHFSSLFVLHDLNNDIESRVRVLSGAPNANIIGETLDIAVIEQVENMNPSKMINDIFPMLSATGGCRVLAGTPSLEVKNTYYYDLMTKPEKQRPPYGTNPDGSFVFTVDWKEAAKFSSKYHDFVRKEADRIGVDSDEFRATYNIEWIVLRNKFITRQELEALGSTILKSQKPKYPHYLHDPDLPRFIGWDPARGEDRSVMTCIERDDAFHHWILEWLEFQGIKWETQLDDAINFLQVWKPQVLLIDSTGLGDPIPEFANKWFREKRAEGVIDFDCYIEGYKYTSQSKDEINKMLDAEMHMKRVSFPVDTPQRREREHFKEDFLNLERNYKGNKLNLDHPDRHGTHNDYCTSLELALYASLKRSFTPVMRETTLF